MDTASHEECKDLPLFVNGLASLASLEVLDKGEIRLEYGSSAVAHVSSKFGATRLVSQRQLFQSCG